ncbi:aminotransferase class V-fold PLP-dependent enzyme [Shewanella sp. VB17]|uniref:DegT/DnrJ/EryC1/StrS family aminotransferase n=1 Tax=Shewanella sp. VB17 TaxID=2739432 RepID=UPI001565E016|nr:aminotransferase class V-fold PLP-dependent enzyme [Shewanella sp. VB17]NRD74706.1 aminotransferase class V-fold PLP-dependent enzyme [Shewanella sp. VB17]
MSKKLSLFGVVSTTEMQDIACEVLESGRIASGKYVELFESKFANLIEQQYVISTNDMTNAIHLALRLSGVTQGDEVIATAFSCMASNSPIALCGATAVWVDFKPNSVEIDLELFELSISEKTKAAIVYHVAGYPTPIDEIESICKKHGVKLIEDCNNSLLSMVNGKYVGGFGDFSVFSFYPNRQINTTEGGMLICKNLKDYELGKKLRRFGIDSSSFRNSLGEINSQSDIPIASYSMNMNNLCAALGYSQIDDVKDNAIIAQNNAQLYNELFLDNPSVRIMSILEGAKAVFWVYLVQVDDRDKVIELMKEHEISVSSLHQRNDIYSCFSSSDNNSLDNIADLQKTILALPCGWWLSRKDIEYIANILNLITSKTISSFNNEI